jgi:glyoxylase-like metal-dependent hydrolase (beta-lactamase superfamily II)
VTETFEAAAGITAIDTMMVGRPQVTSAYLLRANEPAIVETGPTTSIPSVLEGLSALGIGPGDLAHIIVTHIHLDHAGGAGSLAPHFPGATVWVHERGAAHLADPSKLVENAARVYGGADQLRALFGPVEPVPAGRIRSLTDGDTIELGNRSLRVIYTPGHASHQVAFVDSDTGALFTGDALGVFLPDVRVLRPATPPPEFDLEMAVESVRRIQAAAPTLLLFSHFGPAAQVSELCELAIRRLRDWTAYVEEAMATSDELDDVAEALTLRTAGEFRGEDGAALDPDRYDLLSSVRMNAMGILRYVHRRRDAGRPL